MTTNPNDICISCAQCGCAEFVVSLSSVCVHCVCTSCQQLYSMSWAVGFNSALNAAVDAGLAFKPDPDAEPENQDMVM